MIVGHSEGALAAMRLLEEIPLRGCVLVDGCQSVGDMLDADKRGETETDWFNREWLWDEIKKNVGSFGIHLFHTDQSIS